MLFSLREDRKIKNRIHFKYLKSTSYVGIDPNDVDMINDVTVLFMEGNDDSIYPDIIESPVFMISNRLKQLIEPYETSVKYKHVVLSQVKEEKQLLYWLMVPEQLECLSKNTEYYPNGWVKKVVTISEQKISHRIFQINLQPRPLFIINLDVSEAIMRRSFDGVVFEPVDSIDAVIEES